MLKTLTFPHAVKPKRRSFTTEQKRLIAQESLAPGVSVSRIARAHDVNTNQVFKWRREYLDSQIIKAPQALLPVVLNDIAHSELRQTSAPHKQPAEQDGLIELHLAGGRVCVSGSVNLDVLRAVLHSLAR